MEAHYCISWYEKDTNILLGEIPVNFIPYADLQQVFNLASDEPLMYESHLVEQRQAQRLSRWLVLTFDFSQYIYQLDCFKIGSDVSLTLK